MILNDTIAAISTPPGRGGIGIVRLSGPQAMTIAVPLLRLRVPLIAGQVQRARVVNPEDGVVLDEAVVTYFAAPRSYTTEDVIEIACHGVPVLLAAVLAACVAQGARLAQPGEFTQRAFLAGRLDLTEAEAVHDLIAAHTLAQAKEAAAQLGGSIARALFPLRQVLLALIAEMEAGVDFAEDDLDLLSGPQILERLTGLNASLGILAASYRFGRVLHMGFKLAVAGKPNAGKSSLFNRLLGRDRAIVTDQPGTTRDTITESFELGGIPVHLVDTAGIRVVPDGPAGEPERQGILRTEEALAEADVLLLVTDASDPGQHEGTLARIGSLENGARRPVLRVRTKADLLAPGEPPGAARTEFLTSAVTGEGLDQLREAILRAVTGPGRAEADTAVITNLRQHTALTAALTALRSALSATQANLPHELILLDLYAALESLDMLTGATNRDEVLNLIFSTFCIGK